MLHPEPILSFDDNYIWAINDGARAVLVDPGEAEPVLEWLNRQAITPVAVLLTHHHGDHCGGVEELLRHYSLPVYGPARDAIRGVDHPLGEGSPCSIEAMGLEFKVLEIPGHTLGHLAYFGHGWLFCGDALFSCGCGKVFEGTPAMLHASLQRLAALPGDTLVCCAHEYTLANLRFALQIDPHNPNLIAWQASAQALRRADQPTLPVRLADELARNPFLRCHTDAVKASISRLGSAPGNSPAEAFAALRQLKNTFKPPVQ